MQRKVSDVEKTELLERKRRLASRVEALGPSKKRAALRADLEAIDKLLTRLGYRRLR